MKTKTKILGSLALAGAFTTALAVGLTVPNKQVDACPQVELSNDEEISLNSKFIVLNASSASNELPDVSWYNTSDMTGYSMNTMYYFTPNIDRSKAVEALKDYSTFYDNKNIHGCDLTVTFNESSVSSIATFPDGTKKSRTGLYKTVDAIDGVEFAVSMDSNGNRYSIVVAKNSVTKDFDLNQIAVACLKAQYAPSVTPSFILDYNTCLQEENEEWVDSYMAHGNGKHYKCIANARILNDLTVSSFAGIENNDSYVGPTDTSTQFPAEDAPSIQDKKGEDAISDIKNTTSEFMANLHQKYREFKMNTTTGTKVAAAVVSSVLGISLIYGAYLIIKKITRCLRKH